ncbi:MAG TPA: hypothetical protein PLP23_05905 [Panacibacter sp.]|nr:hypothetical protein [Panacibacter sp.]
MATIVTETIARDLTPFKRFTTFDLWNIQLGIKPQSTAESQLHFLE